MRAASCVVLVLAVLAAVAVPAAARFGMPDPLTERGKVIESIYAQVAVAGILVFVLVFALLAWVLVRYRAGSGHGRATHEKERHSLGAELLWTIVPLLIVLWVGWIGWQGLRELDAGMADETADYHLDIIGAQWTWIADYGKVVGGSAPVADGDVESVRVSSSPGALGEVGDANRFIVPADRSIRLNITSLDVIHAFYIQDSNGAGVGMVDAVPFGPHRYNHMTVTLPAGEYFVQCKEMCMNPGHAYMRARIQAVPEAEFQAWLGERAACLGADLCEFVSLSATAADFNPSAVSEFTVGTRVILDLANPNPAPVTVQAPTGADNVTVPAGATGRYVFTVGAGNQTLSLAGGFEGSRTVSGLSATVVRIDLGNMRLLPSALDLEAGKTYLFQATNVHSAPHNFAIGAYPDALARTPDASPGQTVSVTFTPTGTGTYGIWCAVAGHYEAGMRGTATVA